MDLSRWPIRWRVTAAFASALAVVLAGVGAFLYLRVSQELDRAVEQGLLARAAEISGPVSRGDLPRQQPPSNLLDAEESLAQVLGPDGSILASSAPVELQLLSPEQVREALAGATFFDRPEDVVFDDDLRLLAAPVESRSQTMVVVVGASLDDKEDALTALGLAEVIGLTGALVVASAAGYLVAGLALRPVETLRRRATRITALELAATTGPPLPVPPTQDEIGRLASTLNDMLLRLRDAQAVERAALDRERRFVAEASHQLRTPLSVIKSEVELAELEPAAEGQPTATLRSIGEEVDRLTRLTGQLLTLAASEEQQPALDSEPALVAELLERVGDMHRSRAVREGRAITVSAPPGLEVSADELLVSALDNLVDNALEHGRGDVSLTGTAVDEGVRLGVRDQGQGIPEELATQAFERFRKGAGSPGSGLGLSIVQAVARLHGGTLRAGPGPDVSITLPRGGR